MTPEGISADVRDAACQKRHVIVWYRNVSLFPIRGERLDSPLRIDFPWPDDHWPGTLTLSAQWFLAIVCCYYRKHLHSSTGPLDFSTQLRPKLDATITHHRWYRWTQISGVCFRPVHLCCPRTHLVSCYAFLREWLLLSLSPKCLSPWTHL